MTEKTQTTPAKDIVERTKDLLQRIEVGDIGDHTIFEARDILYEWIDHD